MKDSNNDDGRILCLSLKNQNRVDASWKIQRGDL